MPYNSVSDVPDSVPKAKRKQWLKVWNSIYGRTQDESRAFAGANSAIKLLGGLEDGRITKAEFDGAMQDLEKKVKAGRRKQAQGHTQAQQHTGNSGNVPAMPADLLSQGEPAQPYFMEDKKIMANANANANVLSRAAGDGTGGTGGTYISGFKPGGGSGSHNCGSCAFYCDEKGCSEPKVQLDPEVPDSTVDGYKAVDAGDGCAQFVRADDAGVLRAQGAVGGADGTGGVAGVPQFHKFIRITKVDEAKREVGGAVTAEVSDAVGETCHYKTTRPYFEQWSENLSKASNGKNLGNLREMHGLSAAGAGKSIDFDDDAKSIYMTFKVVDDAAWKKCAEGVYTGFSQGGDYIRKWDGPNGEKFYTARPTEVSLVDLPCLPDATFDFVRADGTHELRKFSQGGNDMATPTATPDIGSVVKRLEALERAGVKKARASNVLNNFKKTEQNKDKINAAVESTVHKVAERMGLSKDMYTLKSFAQVLQDLCYIRMSCEYESQREGDDSQLPAALQQDLESLAESFLSMAQEEVGELVQSADSIGKAEGGRMLKLAPAGLEKAAKNIATHFAKMKKGVEDFHKTMSESLGQAHKILGVEEATSLGDGKPQAAGAVPADATKPDYSFKVMKLADGDDLVVYSDADGKVVKTEVIKAGSQPATQGEVAAQVAKGIEEGMQQILKAMYGDDAAVEEVLKAAKKPAAGSASGSASSSASGSASGGARDATGDDGDGDGSASGDDGDGDGSASGSASGKPAPAKKAAGIGDRTQTPTVLSGAGPVVRVMPQVVTKVDDNRMVDAVLPSTTITQDDVLKAMQGDKAAALKLMKGAIPTEVPPTVADAMSKIGGARA